VHSTTGFAPFELDEDEKPLLPIDFLTAKPIGPTDTTCQKAGDMVDSFKAKMLLAKENIQQAQDWAKAYFDKSVKDVKFSVGDMVYVSTKHLLQGNISSRPNKSLSSTFQGPFPIVEVMSPTVYKLELPPKWKVHPVMHVAVLKRYHSPAIAEREILTKPEPEILEGDEVWEVEEILDKRIRYNKVEYLIKWFGFDTCNNTWEKLKNLVNCEKAIAAYENSQKSKMYKVGKTKAKSKTNKYVSWTTHKKKGV
jgi:hypothetical protein